VYGPLLNIENQIRTNIMSNVTESKKAITQSWELAPGYPIVGLMKPNGEFRVAYPQIVELFSLHQSNAVRNLKRLLGKGSSPKSVAPIDKVSSDLNSKPVVALTLEQFETLIVVLAKQGNQKALELTFALVGLSLHQIFCDQFGQKFDKEDRDRFLNARLSGKVQRGVLTDAIKNWMSRHDVPQGKESSQMYINVTDTLYRRLTGKRAFQLKRANKTKNVRDSLTEVQLSDIEACERHAARLIDSKDTEPVEAINEAIDFYFDPMITLDLSEFALD
jgi:hypothetical protein